MDDPQVLQCPHRRPGRRRLQVLVNENRSVTLKRHLLSNPENSPQFGLNREEREWLTGVLGNLQEEELDRDLAPTVNRVV